MSKQNQNRRVRVIAVSTVAAVIILLLGYLFWNNFAQNKENDNTQQVSHSKEDKKSTSPVDAPKIDDTKLTLSDWKIAFTIPDSLKTTSIKYYERQSNDTPPANSYAFTTKRIQDLGGQCITQQFGDTVILTRFDEDQPAYPDSYWVSPDKIGGYRYVLSGPIASCSGAAANTQASPVEISDKEALIQLVKSIALTE